MTKDKEEKFKEDLLHELRSIKNGLAYLSAVILSVAPGDDYPALYHSQEFMAAIEEINKNRDKK
jgi:hypothetical protein